MSRHSSNYRLPNTLYALFLNFFLGEGSVDELKYFRQLAVCHRGPLVCLVIYDGALTLRFPDNVTTIGFADDIEIIVVAKHLGEIYTSEKIWEINFWLKFSSAREKVTQS